MAKEELLEFEGVVTDVLPEARARRALANYPMGPAGSPVACSPSA